MYLIWGLVLLMLSGPTMAAMPADAPVRAKLAIDAFDYAEKSAPEWGKPYSPQLILLATTQDDEWRREAANILAEVMRQFLGGLAPDPKGVEHPNPHENPIDQYVHRIGQTRWQVLLQGVGNFHMIRGPYLFNSIRGGVGVEYDFQNLDDPDTLVAIRVAPLHVEMAWIRTAAGARQVEGLPSSIAPGASAGLEVSKTFGAFEPGVRSYITGEFDAQTSMTGATFYKALYCKIRLDRMFPSLKKLVGREIHLTPSIEYYDRGDAKARVMSWNEEPRLERMTRFWQMMTWLEIKF